MIHVSRLLESKLTELEIKSRPLLTFDDAFGVRTGDGYVLVPKNEPTLLLMLADATTGGLEPGTRRCLLRLLEPGMNVVDVGANLGLLTLASARAVGATGKVYAFEPEHRMAELLERAVAMNGFVWCTIARSAVGAQNEEREFFVSAIPGHSSLFELPSEERAKSETVQVVRLDDAIPAGEPISVVKIDVEGAELDVLRGMDRVLAENADIALIAEYGPSHLDRVGIPPKAWFDEFLNRGLVPYAIDEATGQCSPCSPENLEGVHSVNIAFARSGTRLEARLRA